MIKRNKLSGKEQKQAAELGLRMNAQLRLAKEEFEAREFESKSEDGAVAVVVSGRREIKSLSINMSADKENDETFISVIVSTINKGLSDVREANIRLTEDVKNSFNLEARANKA